MTTEWKEAATQLKEKTTDFISGEITLTKLDFCLIGLIGLFAGICIGLLTAPLTHGISIGSHNGCYNGNNSPGSDPDEDGKDR